MEEAKDEEAKVEERNDPSRTQGQENDPLGRQGGGTLLSGVEIISLLSLLTTWNSSKSIGLEEYVLCATGKRSFSCRIILIIHVGFLIVATSKLGNYEDSFCFLTIFFHLLTPHGALLAIVIT